MDLDIQFHRRQVCFSFPTFSVPDASSVFSSNAVFAVEIFKFRNKILKQPPLINIMLPLTVNGILLLAWEIIRNRDWQRGNCCCAFCCQKM